VLLNLAFVPREVVKDFIFGPGISTTFKTAMSKNKVSDYTAAIQLADDWSKEYGIDAFHR